MIIAALALLGLAFGSFVSAFTWRLHVGKNFVTGRSQCEACGHTLGAADLIPVVSWLMLRGKCRYCKHSISWINPVLEAGMAALFAVSYLFWPTPLDSIVAWASFGLWLVYLVLLVSLVVYDSRWMLLPDSIVWPLVGLAVIDAALRLFTQNELSALNYVSHVALGGMSLGGFYLLLYLASKGKWVGFGDVKLGLFMGIVLGWQQALLALFLANLSGMLFVAPGLVSGRLSLKARVPFGPFLIIGFIISGLFGDKLIQMYVNFLVN